MRQESCRCFISLKTTATPSPFPSKCKPPAAAFPSWCAVFPACTSPNATAPIRWKATLSASEAVEYCRERRGPALIHAHVTRPYSHSLSDDEKLYKTAEEREKEAHRDPLSKFALFLVREGMLDQKQIEALGSGSRSRSPRSRRCSARRRASPPIDSILMQRVFAGHRSHVVARSKPQPQLHGAPKTMVEMVAATLSDEMVARRTHHRLRRRRRRRQPRRESERSEREGRRFQSDRRLAAQIRCRPRFQYAARGSRDRRPGHRHGHARTQARRRNSILRLHLAGDDADSR